MIVDYLLQGTTEGEFFSEGGEERHEADIDEQSAEGIGLEKAFGKDSSCILHRTELMLECSQGIRQGDAAVQVRKEVDRGYGTDHDGYGDEAEETIRFGIQMKPPEGLVIIAPDSSTEDRREEESTHGLQELEPFETGRGLTAPEGDEPDAHGKKGKDRHDGEPSENLYERILFHAAKVRQKLHICKFFNNLFAYMRKK